MSTLCEGKPIVRRASAAFVGASVLTLAAVLAYHNSIHVPFVFDDVPSIVENTTLRDLGRAFSPPPANGFTVDGRPLLNFSLAINYAFGGTGVESYHVLNLVIHVAAGLILWGLLHCTLLLPTFKSRYIHHAMGLAWASALIWTLHPLQTEAVTYVVQRAESLMGLFYLLTLYTFVRGTKSARPWRWFMISAVACLLGMATKEVMVTAPVLVMLYDRTFVAGTFRAAWKLRWGLYLGLAASWIALAYLVLHTGGNRGGTVGFGVGVAPWAYALTQFQALARYLALSFWPNPLVFDYGTFWVRHAREFFLYAALVVPLLVVAGIALWRWPKLGFIGACFFGILAPTSLMPGTIQMIVEHRMYLPLAAVVATTGVGLYALAGKWSLLVLALLALAGGGLTVERNRDYRTDRSLWSDTVAKAPNNARAHNNLGKDLLLAGEGPEAISHFETALRQKPDYAKAHNNLGVALAEMGRFDAAIEHYKAALRLGANDAELHHNFGDALLRMGRLPEAEAHYALAVALQPGFAAAQANNLGSALLERGEIVRAKKLFAEALRLDASFAEAEANLGNAFVASKEAAAAIAHYDAALRLRPNDATSHFNLANAFLALGNLAGAADHYKSSLRIRPDFAEALNNLGTVLQSQGDPAGAAEHYQAALRLGYAPARENLAKLPAAK